MSKHFIDNPVIGRLSAWAIVKNGKRVGKIIAVYPVDGAGKLKVGMWDWTDEGNIKLDIPFSEYSATGGGYDKVSGALAGATFGDTKLTDHPRNWQICLEEAGYEVWSIV